MALLVPLAARHSRRIIAPSEATRGDVVELLGVPEDRVDVTYEGPGMPDGVEPTPEPELRGRLGVGDAPLLLTVSAKRPHKNLERLFDAFARVESEAVLVVPGYATGFEPELRRRADAAATDRIRFTGWLDDRDLEGLYRYADALVFPSLAEGFGLPVLEAMKRGLPVACSNATSLPEVAGEAALYFDPLRTDEIGAAVERLLSDERLREQLDAAGREQAGKFSWDATASATLESYARALA
jgi:glycosyltransferase involved in cell wall biosynthesis